MFFSQGEQAVLLLQCILLGVGLGLYYDVLRLLRRRTRAGAALTFFADALFWLGTLYALFTWGITLAAGQNRYFVIAGAGLGGVVYFALVSGLVLAVLGAVCDELCFLGKNAMRAARWARDRAAASGIGKKIREKAKKFHKTPSLFRKKGLK